MSIGSKLKIESMGMFAALVFYAVVGIIFLALLPLSNAYLPHVGIMGILSLITAYGLFKKRTWALWIIVILFLVSTTFSAYTIYVFFMEDQLLFFIGTIAYLVLTWVFTIYTAMKRAKLET